LKSLPGAEELTFREAVVALGGAHAPGDWGKLRQSIVRQSSQA
jgi:hypothetical protein